MHDHQQHSWLHPCCIAAVVSILKQLQHKVCWLCVQFCAEQLRFSSNSSAGQRRACQHSS